MNHHTLAAASKVSVHVSSVGELLPSRRQATSALLVLGATALWPSGVHAQASGAANELRLLINRTTRLSILSDRITRCQVQRFMGILASRADRVYTDSLAESRQHIAAIRRAVVSAATRSVALEADKQASAFLDANEGWKTTDRAGLAKLSVQADTAGEAVDQLVEAYVKELGQTSAKILQTTADLQRLTQHLAVHYLLAQAKIDAAEQLKEVDKARLDFDSGMTQLRQSPLRNPRIEAGLKSIADQWLFFNTALQKKQADSSALETTSTTSERTLETLTELYTLYEATLK